MEKIVGVIDDDMLYQFVTKKIIEQSGKVKSVLQFFDGEQGIGYIKDNQSALDKLPHLILLDVNMPYLNGWQFLDELMVMNLEEYKPIIYMVSSSSNSDDVQRASTYAILKGYEVKPVTKEKFSALIAEVLN